MFKIKFLKIFKIYFIALITLATISCSPSACDCAQILQNEIDNDFKMNTAQRLILDLDEEQYYYRLSRCADAFTTLNENIDKSNIRQVLRYAQKKVKNAAPIAKAKCN